ncbi:MAG: hypothetical protein QXN26_06630, partial [Thermoplasmataceae archaeon]
MDRKTIAAISVIGIAAIFIRILPSLRAFAIGNDFGIYYTILQEFVKSGKIMDTFPSPWGGAGYGDFPVMYWIIIAFWKATGISYTLLLVKIPPIFGGLASIIIFFIAYKITRNSTISLLAALFDAFNPIIVFQTSISSILVFGHFFGLLTILFFLYYIDDWRYYPAALISSFLLVMSHPLSTYMYVLAVVGIALIGLFLNPRLRNRLHYAAFLYPFSAFIFAYWYMFFPNFSGFLSGGLLHLPAGIIIAGFFVIITFVIFLPTHLLRPYIDRIELSRHRMYQPLIYASLLIYFAAIGISVPLLYVLLPTFSVRDIITILPLMMDGGLAIIGLNMVSGRAKYVTTGWLVLMFISFIYSLLTWNMILYPGRYFEYLFEPLSILEAIGIYGILQSARSSYASDFRFRKRRGFVQTIRILEAREASLKGYLVRQLKRVRLQLKAMRINNVRSFAVIGLLVVVLASSAATPYQVQNVVTPSGNQSINIPDHNAAIWLDHNASRNYSVATDHILGLLLNGYNLSSSFESIYYLWNSTGVNATVLHELMGNSYSSSYNYTSVGYILIDNYMFKNGVWGYDGLTDPYIHPVPMDNASFLKFFNRPFQPVYFNYTSPSSWAIVFQVNWSAIDSTFNLNISPVHSLATQGNI